MFPRDKMVLTINYLENLIKLMMHHLECTAFTGAHQRFYSTMDAVHESVTEMVVANQLHSIDDQNFEDWLNHEDQPWHDAVIEHGQWLTSDEAACFLMDEGRLMTAVEQAHPDLHRRLLELEQSNRREAPPRVLA